MNVSKDFIEPPEETMLYNAVIKRLREKIFL